MHQILYNMISTNYLNTKAFDYIDPRGENIAYISWEIRAYYKCTLNSTPVHFFSGRDMIFNLASIIYWRVITVIKQQQFDIDNACKNATSVRHDCAVGKFSICG